MSMWKVFVSDVEVGEIPGHTLEEIKQSVRRDPRMWAAMAFDFVRPMRQLTAVFTFPPLLLGWLVIIMAMIDPGVFAQALDMAVNQPDMFRKAVMNLFFYSVMLSVMLMVIRSFFMPSVLSGAYDRELARKLRRFMKIPSEGDVRLERNSGSIN